MLVTATTENLDRAAALLRNGAVVAFPTETVYGLGARAYDAAAVARIFDIKARPAFDPLIVHVADEAMLASAVEEIPDAARALIDAFWPGPLTLVLRKRGIVPPLVTSGLPTVGVRMPAHPVARELLTRVGTPLAAPSANPFGYLSPTRAEHVERMLGGRVEMILDGGTTQHGLESTIVMLEPRPTLLRPGALSTDDIESVIGPIERRLDKETQPLAPGRLESHYAPATPIRIVAADVPQGERAGAGLLAFREKVGGYAMERLLSPSGDLRQAAANLFEYLHELDVAGLERIDVQPVPLQGIGIAIMDRLQRARHR